MQTELRTEIRQFLVAVFVFAALVGVALAATDVSIVTDGRVALVQSTPALIGNAAGRVELRVKNDQIDVNLYCGGTPGALSKTPGANSGYQYDPARQVTELLFPDKPIYCVSPDSAAIVSYHEARMVTATATSTATPTNTPS